MKNIELRDTKMIKPAAVMFCAKEIMGPKIRVYVLSQLIEQKEKLNLEKPNGDELKEKIEHQKKAGIEYMKTKTITLTIPELETMLAKHLAHFGTAMITNYSNAGKSRKIAFENTLAELAADGKLK